MSMISEEGREILLYRIGAGEDLRFVRCVCAEANNI